MAASRSSPPIALFVLADRFDVSPFLGLILVVPAMAAVGWALQRTVLERSARGGLLAPMLRTFGLSIVIDNLLFQAFGADTRSLAPYIGDFSYDSWSLTDDIDDRQACGADFGRGGRAARRHAIVPDPHRARPRDPRDRRRPGHGRASSASMRGASTRSRRRSRWRRSASPAPSSRCARPSIPMRAPIQLIFAFEAAVIGGAGSLWGTLVGGVVLGVAQNIGAQINPQGFFITGHGVFLAILFGRLFFGDGRRVRRAGRGGGHERTRRSRVVRWSALSSARVAVAALALIVAARLRAAVPRAPMSIDKLTTLFIYVMLAVTWNALAGYGGLVSIGQQAFFGLGAYAAVRLADAGVSVYPALVDRRAIWWRRCRCRSRPSCCACAPANSRSACGSSPRSRICSSISTRWCAARPALR